MCLNVRLKMSPELKQLCILVALSLPVGLAVGLLLRKKKPNWCKNYTKSCLDRKWWLFLGGLILFIGLSAASFVSDRPYFGIFFLGFALLEAFCLVNMAFNHFPQNWELRLMRVIQLGYSRKRKTNNELSIKTEVQH